MRQFVGLALGPRLSQDGDRELISSIVRHQKVKSMSIWERLTSAAAGIADNGHIVSPVRGLLGAFAGSYSLHHNDDSGAQHQVAFTIGVIALGAKMAKADGIVTRDEVIAFKEVFKVPEGEMENVSRIFNLAKQDVVGYETYASQLACAATECFIPAHPHAAIAPNLRNHVVRPMKRRGRHCLG